MRVVLQRVSRASVTVDGETVGAIEGGLLLLVGVAEGDTEDEARRSGTASARRCGCSRTRRGGSTSR